MNFFKFGRNLINLKNLINLFGNKFMNKFNNLIF